METQSDPGNESENPEQQTTAKVGSTPISMLQNLFLPCLLVSQGQRLACKLEYKFTAFLIPITFPDQDDQVFQLDSPPAY
jgi:hypothetical protein